MCRWVGTCHDVDAPAGREYALIVDCFGLAGIPNAFPFMAFGPYGGSGNGSFSPSGQGTASCLGPFSVGLLGSLSQGTPVQIRGCPATVTE